MAKKSIVDPRIVALIDDMAQLSPERLATVFAGEICASTCTEGIDPDKVPVASLLSPEK